MLPSFRSKLDNPQELDFCFEKMIEHTQSLGANGFGPLSIFNCNTEMILLEKKWRNDLSLQNKDFNLVI